MPNLTLCQETPDRVPDLGSTGMVWGYLEVSLPTVNVYNVEFAELPNECYGGGLASPAPLPASIPMDKIMSNIAPELQTSVFHPCETWCSLGFMMIYEDTGSPEVKSQCKMTHWM